MTQTELRIGNFVSAKTTSESFNIISEIGDGGSGRGWYVRLENVNHGVWLEHDGRFLIEGIEITEEWLLKFGFKNKNGQNRYELKHIGMVLLNDSVCVTMYDAYNEVDNSLVLLNYIHQLQNLYFALVGSELQLLEAEV